MEVQSPTKEVEIEVVAEGKVVRVSSAEFHRLYSPGVPVYFGFDECQPCREVRPVVETLAKELGVVVLEVRQEDCPDICEEYGVESFPTFFAGDVQAEFTHDAEQRVSEIEKVLRSSK